LNDFHEIVANDDMDRMAMITGIPGMEGILRRRDLPSINLQTTTQRSRPSIVHRGDLGRP
jgi:hypothetical protein